MKKYLLIFSFLILFTFLDSCQTHFNNNEYVLEKYKTIFSYSFEEKYFGLYVEDYIYLIKEIDNIRTCFLYDKDTLDFIEEKPFPGLSFIKYDNYYYILDSFYSIDNEYTTIKEASELFNETTYSNIFTSNKFLGYFIGYDSNNKFFLIYPTTFKLNGEENNQYVTGTTCVNLVKEQTSPSSLLYLGYLFNSSIMLFFNQKNDITYLAKGQYIYESYTHSINNVVELISSNDINPNKEYYFWRVFYDGAYIWLLAKDYDNNIDLLKVKVVNPF